MNKPDTDPGLSPKAAEEPAETPGSDDQDAPVESPGQDGASDKNETDKGQSTPNQALSSESLDRTTFSSIANNANVTTPDKDALVDTVLLAKYKVIELLGSGGMSRVYKATNQLTRKNVALKLLHKHLSSNPVMMKRFQAEAQASHHLAHPHIITVYDFGLTEDQQPFLVMDYLEGRALSEIIRTWGQLSIERCLKITDQILEALEHAHDSGVLHRDLKPSNIVLIPVGEDTDYVKLVDFGIAKILPKAGLEAQELTQSGDVFGSPLYMSPEQCLGNMTDARSDIYSVGCLMYECLTGRPPLVGNNTLDTMHRQVSEMPASLSNIKADVRLVKQLEDIIFKAMAKEPENRFQSATEMRRSIAQTQAEWKEGSALLAYMRRTGAKLERNLQNKFGKRWRAKVAVTALVAAVVLHYTIMMTVLYRPGSAPDISERIVPWSAVNQPVYKLVAEEKMRKLNPIADTSDKEEMMVITTNLSNLSGKRESEFRNLLIMGAYRLNAEDFEIAYDNFRKALSVADSINQAESMDGGFLHVALAACLVEMYKLRAEKDVNLLEAALKNIREASFIFFYNSQARPKTFALALKANICTKLNRLDEAYQTYRAIMVDTYGLVSQKVKEQRDRERLTEYAPIDFHWGNINQSNMGYELATMGEFLLSRNDSINEMPWGLPAKDFPFDTSTVPGMPCRNKIHDLVFFGGHLAPRCTFQNDIVETYNVDAQDVYQLLVNMYEQRGEGRGSLTTAVARANLGLATLKKGQALRNYAIDQLRNRNFDSFSAYLNQANELFKTASSELQLARKALELHLGSNHKYLAFVLLNLSDAELNMFKFNEALEARAEAEKILGAKE